MTPITRLQRIRRSAYAVAAGAICAAGVPAPAAAQPPGGALVRP